MSNTQHITDTSEGGEGGREEDKVRKTGKDRFRPTKKCKKKKRSNVNKTERK